MGDLAIRRNLGFAPAQYQSTDKTEKTAGSGQARRLTGTTVTVSETLRQLMGRVSQAENHIRESRRTLQTGEGVLDEVQEKLGRMEELLRQAADGGGLDRDAVQKELEELEKEIDRMLSEAAVGGTPLFLDEGAGLGDGVEALLFAVMGGNSPDPAQAMEVLRQLMEKVKAGATPDEAIEVLTEGKFTSLSDYLNQFSGSDFLELQKYLIGLLSAESGSLLLSGASLMTLLEGLEGSNLDMIMGLLTALQGSGGAQELETGAGGGAAGPQEERFAALEFEGGRVTGRDLSGVSFNPSTGELTLAGTGDVALRGSGQGIQTLVMDGSGEVTLQNVKIPVLLINGETGRVFTAGVNTLGQIQMGEGSTLILDGRGLLSFETLQANESNTLRLAGGAAAVGEEGGYVAVPVVVEGPASLAAMVGRVVSPEGKELKPFDLIWKTLLPGWSSITSLTVNGQTAKLALLRGDPVRLWLDKGDPSQGYPGCSLEIQGRDKAGRTRTRYAYLRWNRRAEAFQESSPDADPFSVTGGEPGRDWVYDEASHTLHILSALVTAVSVNRKEGEKPFNGRIVLADGIGMMRLALGGVMCRADSGSAFSLGRENDVTLLLQSGTKNLFESGEGCAGISLGEGTSLSIDSPMEEGEPDGILTALGGSGGAGIGRDSGGGQDQESHIMIRGGVITASGSGGGAGIGAGMGSAMGPIIIFGGTVTCTGGDEGGAGIGGALGAPVGDISIQGGAVAAEAICHAAAIGAGVQGECGDILIAGTAKIVKALGGNPGADIGACLFGSCGKVLISGDADIGGAQLCTQTGIPLRMGEETVILPQFRLSAKALRLDQMKASTLGEAQASVRAIDADRQWVSRIQGVYGALYSRLGRTGSGGAEPPVRDTGAAGTLLEEMRRSILSKPGQVVNAYSRRAEAQARKLLQS